MGTRCLTKVYDEQGEEIITLYRQFDGYPDGHGKELKAFLGKKKLINGIGSGYNASNAFNGMGCLATALVAHFKKDIGGFYLYPPKTTDVGEEFIYKVTGKEGEYPKVEIEEPR